MQKAFIRPRIVQMNQNLAELGLFLEFLVLQHSSAVLRSKHTKTYEIYGRRLRLEGAFARAFATLRYLRIFIYQHSISLHKSKLRSFLLEPL